MKRNEYLRLALQLNLFAKKAWIVTAFSITRDNPGAPYPGKLIPQPWGYSFITSEGTEEKIEDIKAGEVMFRFKDRLTIDSTWATNVKEPTETSIGNLLFNAICILSSFGSKYPYITGKITVSAIEESVAKLLQDTPVDESKRSSTLYYVDEYIKFVDSLQYLSTLTQLTTISATRKAITAPTGIKEFKAKLIEKYGDKLSDPVVLAQFEKELMAFDDEYMKGDPSDGTFVAGKIKHTARKKMFLSMGAELQFSNSQTVTPITRSLQEGWPTDPVSFTASLNGLRVGSFSRGAETVKGGVSAKYLLRAANNFKIVDTDCGTKLGISRLYNKDNIAQIQGRYLILGNKVQFVENIAEANNYLNQTLTLRTPMFCKLEGDNICKVCAGIRLAQYPTGLTIPLTEVSAIILNASLKLMHTSSTTTAKMNIADSLT